jgi:hypothetical protein
MNVNTELKRKLKIALWIIVPLVVLVIALDWWGMRIFPTRIIGKPVDGQVIEYETGKPLQGAMVIVKWTASTANSHGGSTSACYHLEYAITDKDGRFNTDRWVIEPSDVSFGLEKSRLLLGGMVQVVKPGFVTAPSNFPNNVGSAQIFGQSFEPNGINMALARNFTLGRTEYAENIPYKGLNTMLGSISACDFLPLWVYESQERKPPKEIGEATRRAMQAWADIYVFQGQAFATLYPEVLKESPNKDGPSSYAQQATKFPYAFEYFGIKPRPIPIELTTKPVTNYPDPLATKIFGIS